MTTLVGLTGAFVAPFLPVFLSQILHASPLQSALFLFLTPVAAVTVSSYIGRISDRPGGRERVLYVAAGCGIVGFALYAVARHFWFLLAISITLVAVAGAIVPQIYALGREVVQRQDPSKVTMGMNALRMMMSLAWATGAPLGAFVIGLIDFDGLFLATSMLHLVALGVVIMLRDSVRDAAKRTAESIASDPTPGGSAAAVGVDATVPSPDAPTEGEPGPAWLTRGRVIGITVAFVVMQSVTALTVATMPLFVSVDLGGDLSSAGVVLGLCATIEIPLMLLFGSMATRFPLRGLLLAGGGFGIAYCMAVSAATAVWHVAVAQLLHACYVCAISGLGISYFQGLMPAALGRSTTLFTNAGKLAGMLAGLAFGVVQVLGYRYAYVGSIVLCAIGTTVLAVASRQPTGDSPRSTRLRRRLRLPRRRTPRSPARATVPNRGPWSTRVSRTASRYRRASARLLRPGRPGR